MKSEFGNSVVDEVKRHLLIERDREVKKVLGIDHRQIASQLITDLYSLPGAGGSDERFMARDWFFREIGLFGKREDKFKTWTEMYKLLESFHVPYFAEMERLAAELKAGRSR